MEATDQLEPIQPIAEEQPEVPPSPPGGPPQEPEAAKPFLLRLVFSYRRLTSRRTQDRTLEVGSTQRQRLSRTV